MEQKPRYKVLSESQVSLIEELAGKGMADVKISQQMGLKYGTVSHVTTRYWKRKMDIKDV